jgi:hypothetical protein
MTILENLERVRTALQDASMISDPSPMSSALNEAAMAAMFEGMPKGDPSKKKWGDYMAIFCANQDQLTRLTVEAQDEEKYLKQMRAYIVADGICDPGTNFNIGMHIDNKIDGIANSLENPPVDDTPKDDGSIANRRPKELKDIVT